MTNLDDEQLQRSYVLGELRETELERVEERLFSDDAYYGRLLTIEEELIRDYARGRLPGSIHRRFERRLAASPDWAARVEEARALVDVIREDRRARRGGLLQRAWSLGAAIAPAHVVRRLAMAAAVMIALAGIWWLAVDRRALSTRVERLESERAETERRTNDIARGLAEQHAALERLGPPLANSPGGEPSPPGRVATFLLLPGGVRSADAGAATLRVPADMEVRLLLTLGERRGHSGYRVLLRTVEGVQVWGGNAAVVGAPPPQDTVEVRLPGRVLAPADYVLRLQGTTPSAVEDLDAYVFRVLR